MKQVSYAFEDLSSISSKKQHQERAAERCGSSKKTESLLDAESGATWKPAANTVVWKQALFNAGDSNLSQLKEMVVRPAQLLMSIIRFF